MTRRPLIPEEVVSPWTRKLSGTMIVEVTWAVVARRRRGDDLGQVARGVHDGRHRAGRVCRREARSRPAFRLGIDGIAVASMGNWPVDGSAPIWTV